MADIFISYSSKDREVARKLASALSARGHSVWWDRDIVTGESFDRVIELELDSARAVVVLWTHDSVASEWVKNEAASAAERGVLLPLGLDDARPPLEFRRRQTADLRGWGGDASHEGFQALCRGVDKLLRGEVVRPEEAVAARPARQPGNRLFKVAFVVVVLLFIGAFIFNYTRDREPDAAAVDQSATRARQTTVPQSATPSPADEADLSTLAAGVYFGRVTSDTQGSSRSNITVTLTPLGENAVRLTSKYERMGTVDIELTRIGDKLFHAGGDTPFILDLSMNPPTLEVNPHNSLAYVGVKRSAAGP